MNKILRPYIGKFVKVYLDDVIIHSRSKEEHIKHVRAVFQKIREANLKLKPSKCKWFEQELTFVGYKIGINGIKPDPRNIEKIKNAQVPSNTIQLRGFLGLAQYYRQYVKDYADIAGLLLTIYLPVTSLIAVSCVSLFELELIPRSGLPVAKVSP